MTSDSCKCDVNDVDNDVNDTVVNVDQLSVDDTNGDADVLINQQLIVVERLLGDGKTRQRRLFYLTRCIIS